LSGYPKGVPLSSRFDEGDHLGAMLRGNHFCCTYLPVSICNDGSTRDQAEISKA
jgi:hypothetical protein